MCKNISFISSKKYLLYSPHITNLVVSVLGRTTCRLSLLEPSKTLTNTTFLWTRQERTQPWNGTHSTKEVTNIDNHSYIQIWDSDTRLKMTNVYDVCYTCIHDTGRNTCAVNAWCTCTCYIHCNRMGQLSKSWRQVTKRYEAKETFQTRTWFYGHFKSS